MHEKIVSDTTVQAYRMEYAETEKNGRARTHDPHISRKEWTWQLGAKSPASKPRECVVAEERRIQHVCYAVRDHHHSRMKSHNLSIAVFVIEGGEVITSRQNVDHNGAALIWVMRRDGRDTACSFASSRLALQCILQQVYAKGLVWEGDYGGDGGGMGI